MNEIKAPNTSRRVPANHEGLQFWDFAPLNLRTSDPRTVAASILGVPVRHTESAWYLDTTGERNRIVHRWVNTLTGELHDGHLQHDPNYA